MEFLFGLYLFLTSTVMVVSSTMFIIACVNIFKDRSK